MGAGGQTVADGEDRLRAWVRSMGNGRAFSSDGRALPLQGRGRRFDSVNAHYLQFPLVRAVQSQSGVLLVVLARGAVNFGLA